MKICQVVENEALVKACETFQKAVADDDFKNYCHQKSEDVALSEHDRSVWKLMRVICFEDKAREELLNYLGFDTSNIVDMATQYAQSLACQSAPSIATDTPADWASGITNAVGQLTLSDDEKTDVAATTAGMVSSAVKGEEAEHMIRKALVVGNFSAAVDVCLEAGLMTEALLLAQCGDPDLWARTQHEFFVRQRKRKPFLNILQSVIKNELMGYVLQSDLNKWRETLALLSTYGKSDEFNDMCEALANRLETEMNDIPSATLCYMCATNVERTIEFWATELKAHNNAKGSTDTVALQQFVEKVVVYTSAHKVDDLGVNGSKYFAEYAGLLASQGVLDVAPDYLKGDSPEEVVLRDRLFHAGPKQVVGARPPVFPFERVTVQAVSSAAVGANSAGFSEASSAASTFANPSGVQAQPQVQAVEQEKKQVNTPSKQPQQQQTIPQAAQGGLPAGWIQLQDPTTNRTYYVDQSTGQSQWEPPVPVSTPVPVPVSVPSVEQQSVPQGHQQLQQPTRVQPAQQPSQPEQSQVHQQQPAPEAVTTPEPASVSAGVGGDAGAELQAMLEAVSGKAVGGDKRQVTMVKTALTVLHKQIAGGIVSPETMGKLDQMVLALHSKNSAAANVVNTDLTNSVWGQHKDWIKGLKYLIQLHCKY